MTHRKVDCIKVKSNILKKKKQLLAEPELKISLNCLATSFFALMITQHVTKCFYYYETAQLNGL